jgi:hypothetical protein
MNTRPLCITALLLVAFLLSACGDRHSTTGAHHPPSGRDVRSSLTNAPSVTPASEFGIPFSSGPGRGGSLIVTPVRPDGETSWRLTDGELKIVWDDGTTVPVPYDALYGLAAFGAVDLYGERDQAIVLVSEYEASAWYGATVHVLNPRTGQVVSLGLDQSLNSMTPQTFVRPSENYNDPTHDRERRFLESMKDDFGYRSEEDIAADPDNLNYAIYFWGQANGEITDGGMTLRRFPGSPGCLGNELARMVDGDVTYTAHFKGAVWAYDAAADESFVVFHPDNPYCWPTELRKSGDWLAVNTRGEGVMLINVKTWYLKRTDIHVETITDFSVPSRVATINGSAPIDLAPVE